MLSVKHLICCIARLHNFCIDERLKNQNNGSLDTRKDCLTVTQLSYMHASAEQEHQEIMSYEYPQWSLAREEMVKIIKGEKFERPSINRRKRRRMMQESSQESHSSQDAEPLR